MDTNALKKFAQAARNLLIDQVTSKLDLMLEPASPMQREHPTAMKALNAAIARDGKRQVIEQVAYTWFNRFTALRFMDVNGYTTVGVVSPTGDQTRPELLAEAMAGNLPDGAPGSIAALLDGRTPSSDPQAEAYRQLLVHTCNQWHSPMPFLFEEIDDYTELLMPEDLLSQTSILAELRKVMTEDACQDVEIIGWLYQFYISEKKDQVFAGLKKNQKITAENIPAATQLFTPHWIVRYLVENSLGRLWLLNNPQSGLAAKMEYYIAPEEPETDFLKITRPEEIRICDPAAGSGHMLTYAFDLLYAIYEEEGYDPTEIPALILQHNLTGVEIDDRAGALAAFALAMKAAGKLGRRRFLRMEAKPDICVLQNVSFTPAEMQDVAAVVGKDLFTDELRETLGQFEQAKNFGSLIVPKLRDPAETLRVIEARDFAGDLLLKDVQERVVALLRMAEALSPKYHVVVANPPYMGGKGMNAKLGDFAKERYPDSKLDLYAAFIERGMMLSLPKGYPSMVTMEGWMFLSSSEKLRSKILSNATIISMCHMPYLGRGATSMGISFGTTAFTLRNDVNRTQKGHYSCVRYYESDENGVPTTFPPDNERLASATTEEFSKIPGSPIAYWASPEVLNAFKNMNSLAEVAKPRQGLATSDNDRFLKQWHEINVGTLGFNMSSHDEAKGSGCKWFPCQKGGPFRKWYGNNNIVVNWEDDGKELLEYAASLYGSPTRTIKNIAFYFREGMTWSTLSSSALSMRYSPTGFISETKGAICFSESREELMELLGFSNSCLVNNFLYFLSPTLDYHEGPVGKLPIISPLPSSAQTTANSCVDVARSDWDAYETSWDFTTLPLLSPDHRGATLAASYATLRAHWQSMTDEMQALEEENNRIFIDAYGLQDELNRFDAELKPMISALPSYTQLGMAALLPNRGLSFAADGQGSVLSDGESTQGLAAREKLLATGRAGDRTKALLARDVLDMRVDEGKELFRDNDVVYIYHNLIDAIGDKLQTEDQLPKAAEDAIEELTKLVRKLTSANFSSILITADHGFLYQHRALDESDFAVADPKGDEILMRNRRFVVGRGLHGTAGMKKFSSVNLGLTGDLDVLIPNSINRIRVKGAGSRFVHGGASLQEIVIPVIRVGKQREADVNQVEVQIIVSGRSQITSGQTAVIFYQAQPVSEKMQARELVAGIYAADDTLISDEHVLQFDFTSENAREREMPRKFLLSREADKFNNQDVFLKLRERVGKTSHYQDYTSHRFQLKRGITTDFDF